MGITWEMSVIKRLSLFLPLCIFIAVPPVAYSEEKEPLEQTPALVTTRPEPSPQLSRILNAPSGMVFVKGGCFDMGDMFGNGRDIEKPVHKVCLGDFYMDKNEVTQKAFERMMSSNPSKFKGCLNCPVEQVTWFEAQLYCEKVGKRLPTEAEWEYAARAGGKKVRFGTGKDTIGPDEANFNSKPKYKKSYSRTGAYRGKTVFVGSFFPNALGLYDMAGNVYEWVSDWYHKNYYSNSPKNNPKGPSSGDRRVLRGGAWVIYASRQRTAYRHYDTPDQRFIAYGFRCSQ